MLKSFFDYLAFERKLSVHTITAYRTDLNQFNCYCIENDINNPLTVNSKVIRQWIVFLLEHDNNATSIHRKVSSLRAFYKFCVREGEIESNPAINITLPKKKDRLPTFLNESDVNCFFDNQYFASDFSGIRDKTILQLFYLTGMRRQELINLKISDIDFSRNAISVRGKRNKMRNIPLSKHMLTQLKSYIEIRKREYGTANSFLFITKKGLQVYDKLIYRSVNSFLSSVAATDKKSPHVLRHSFATHMLNAGADLNAIKELLGHANLAATQIYTHNSFKKLRNTYLQAHPRA